MKRILPTRRAAIHSRSIRLFAVLLLVTANNLVSSHGALIDISTRAASLDFYQNEYIPSEGVQTGWVGDVANCIAGTTSQTSKNASLRRVNYFRAMAGVPADVVLNSQFNNAAQEAALMMSANNSLSHDPPSNWDCFTSTGHLGASKSNLFLGRNGIPAIDGYIDDFGGNNATVGHRRWILHPQEKEMGIGEIEAGGSYRKSNALYVVDGHTFDPRPETREEFVAWPPPGYVPEDLVYPRWSAVFDDADLSSTTVSVVGGSVNLTQIAPTSTGDSLGDDFIVWTVPSSGSSSADITYEVTLHDVILDGTNQDIVYNVTAYDPTVVILPGDFDGDGTVNGTDLLQWQDDFGINDDSDSDGDDDSDGQDFLIWQQNASSSAGLGSIPEPSTLLLGFCLVACRVTRRS